METVYFSDAMRTVKSLFLDKYQQNRIRISNPDMGMMYFVIIKQSNIKPNFLCS